jgi:5-methylcytosine-specific restriction enzyme subunit McrC
MSKLFTFFEHFDDKIDGAFPILESDFYRYDFLKRRGEQNCYTITKTPEGLHCSLSYFIGVDWVVTNEVALYVAPKLNKSHGETDYLKMLFSALKHPDVVRHANELFEIKFDAPYIEISQQQDLLTPLLIVQFLRVTQQIVRKGLKKSYYKVTDNLQSKVKGKVMVGQTIKHNVLKNKPLHTFCSYEEFGVNGLENRLLKKALIFVQQYLPSLKVAHSTEYAITLLSYIMPAFGSVNEDIALAEIKHSKINPFYKEYTEATSLARLILKRFGYNIANAHQTQVIKTPPFWIDMSKLFELYVLGLLKDRFPDVSTISYQFGNRGSKLDYLLNSKEYKMVVDAKYKTKYENGVDHLDIRQVSGYARLEKVYATLGIQKDTLINCLIIYPDQENGLEELPVDLKRSAIKDYVGVYKIAVKLPMLTEVL